MKLDWIDLLIVALGLAVAITILALVSGCATIRSYDRLGAQGKIKVTGVVSAVAGVEVSFNVGATRDGTDLFSDVRGDVLDLLPAWLCDLG